MKILPRVLLWFCLSLLLFACSDKKKSETSNSIKKYGVLVKDTLNFYTIASKIPNLLKKYDVPAVSVAVIQEGKVVWSFVHGMQSADKIADEQTLFLTASIAKPLTAEVFLRLVSHGKVSLDEPMYKYWLDPDIADDPRAKLLTPRHVLTHQTGFKNWRYLTDDKLRFERSPGMEMGYSGEGLQYLVLFVERKLGRDFNDIAKEVLFIPEGMKNTAMKQQDWYEGRVAAPKFPDGTWREPVIRAEEIGAGGVHTTAS
ncbi:MAG: serine hydrolase domain-containing protein, partial [Bacteroidota bacterium]